MISEDVLFVAICDVAGQVRGKAFPVHDLPARLQTGVGWTSTCQFISAFGPIGPSPWGPLGDLDLVPDMGTRVEVDFEDGRPAERFVLADIRLTDGTPWFACPRDFLRRGLRALESEFGLTVMAAFEHECYLLAPGVPLGRENRYNLEAFRENAAFVETFMAALRRGGCEPDTIMTEWGPRQIEFTTKPAMGIAAADRAVTARELARATAARSGIRACFSPKIDPDRVGAGCHIHFSLWTRDGRPATYDPAAERGLSANAACFAAGILAHGRALVALTAPSGVSTLRLTHHTWSSAYTNLGWRDREAMVRIAPFDERPGAPDPAPAFNLEYRAADGAASPYMALGAIVWAGLQGLRDGVDPVPALHGDPEALSEVQRERYGIRRLPATFEESLDALAGSASARGWLGDAFFDAYLAHKRFEADLIADLGPAERCAAYAEVY